MTETARKTQCVGCGKHFVSMVAFKAHVVGSPPKARRCMTVVEMLAEGFSLRENGDWTLRGDALERGSTARHAALVRSNSAKHAAKARWKRTPKAQRRVYAARASHARWQQEQP